MIQFLTTKLWKRIAVCARRAQRKRAAIAYVTKDIPLAFSSGDTLIVDASDAAISSGQTSAKVLARLHRRGVQLYNYSPLHSKVVVLDGTVFVSSANLSESSQDTLLEAGLETDDPTVVAQAIGFIESLAEQSERLNAKSIARIAKIPVKKNLHPKRKGKASKKLKLPSDPRTWLLGVHLVEYPKDPAEIRRIAKGEKAATKLLDNPKSETSWVRFGKTYRVSKCTRRGHSLIIIWRSNKNGSPDAVYHHAPVLVNQAEPTCNRIFYESFPDSGSKALRWQEFKSLMRKVGLPPPSKSTVRELTPEQSRKLHESWEEARRK